MRTRITAAAVAMGIAAATAVATGGSAAAHGYTTSTPSRQMHCAQGTVANCGGIQWEPQSVEGPKGFPGGGPSDGRICAGGNSRFSELDQPRNGSWPTAQLSSGANYTFSWRNTARHRTTDYRYYITKNGWNPNSTLTRADLEPAPFLTVPMGGRQPAATESHTGRLPSGKSGRHLILAVWNVYDTANAFYACSDVRF